MLQSGSRRVRERYALGLASALHVSSLAALGTWAIHHESTARRAAPLPAAVEAAQARAADVEVELDFSASAASSSQAAADASERTPMAAGKATIAFAAPRQRASSKENAEPVPDPENAERDETASSWPVADQERRAASIDLGLGADAWQRWIGSTKADSLARESAAHDAKRRPLFHAPPKSTTGGLQEGLEAHDRALGLGPSGPVISALYAAAHSSTAPDTGVARFQITVLESGSVEVSLSEASDHLEGWRAVAARAAEALRRTPPRVPSGRSGMRLAIELRAELALPNGVKAKDLHGPRLVAEPPRFRASQAAQADLKDRNPVAGENKQLAAGTKANVDLPGIYLAESGKVCSYRIGLSALGPLLSGGCDLSNIGAKPHRMVHTLLREEVLF